LHYPSGASSKEVYQEQLQKVKDILRKRKLEAALPTAPVTDALEPPTKKPVIMDPPVVLKKPKTDIFGWL
jgi:hypothetical protein